MEIRRSLSALGFADLRLRFGFLDGDAALLVCVGFSGLRLCFRLSHGDAAFSVCIGFSRLCFGFRLGYCDTLRLACFGFTDSALALFFRDLDTRLVDGFRRRALSDCVNVSAFVCDIGNVDVQEQEPDLVEFLRRRSAQCCAGTFRGRS